MIVDVEARLSAIDLGATGVLRIMQRVRTILSTVKGSVPLDRDFGVDATALDRPLPVAMALLTAGVVAALDEHEPMVKVLSVYFKEDARTGDGELLPVVRLEIEEAADGA